MKLEELFTEGIYLKPKVYAQVNDENMDSAEFHAKGVKLYQNTSLQNVDTYRQVLEEESVAFARNTNIQKTTKLGSVENITITQDKVAFDSCDDKRLWTGNNKSVPYGMKTLTKRNIGVRLELNLCNRVQKYVKITDQEIMEYLGCSMQEFMKHIEKQWHKCDVNVCWQNYGSRWHIDHLAPVAILKTDNSLKMIKKLCNYKNLQPLSASQNASKKDTITDEAREYLKQ